MDKKRLFIAIDFPEYILPLIKQLQFKTDEVRWLKPEQLHLTLVFIGSFDAEKIEELTGLLREIELRPFTMKLQYGGWFPKRGHARVLWAGVECDQILLELHRQISEACSLMGIKQEERDFVPHVTVGRVKKNVHRTYDLTQDFKEVAATFETDLFTVDKFLLYESELLEDGAKYNVIAEFKL